MHNDREERAEVEDCLFESNVVHEELKTENAEFHSVRYFDGAAEDVEDLDDKGSSEVILTTELFLN